MFRFIFIFLFFCHLASATHTTGHSRAISLQVGAGIDLDLNISAPLRIGYEQLVQKYFEVGLFVDLKSKDLAQMDNIDQLSFALLGLGASLRGNIHIQEMTLYNLTPSLGLNTWYDLATQSVLISPFFSVEYLFYKDFLSTRLRVEYPIRVYDRLQLYNSIQIFLDLAYRF